MVHRCTLPDPDWTKLGEERRCTICGVKYVLKKVFGIKSWMRK